MQNHPIDHNHRPAAQLVPGDLNTGDLASFFFLLAGIMLLDLVGFAWVAKGYTYVDIVDDDDEKDEEAEGIHVMGQDEETVLLHDPVKGKGGGGGRD